MGVQGSHLVCPFCGIRLARDNSANVCSPCQAKARDRFCVPPHVSADFWNGAAIQDALEAQHLGQVLRAYRHHPFHGPRPLPQGVVAGWLHLTQAQISRIEGGPAITDLERLTAWARILGIPSRLLWFRLPDAPPAAVAVERPPTRQPLMPSLPTAVRQAALLPLAPLALTASTNPDVAALEAFRAADRQVGGGHLYATVTSYLQSSLAPQLFGSRAIVDGSSIFTAASGFTEMAGWMAHDAGHDDVAKRPFHRSLDLARSGGDCQLRAHIYARLSQLLLHLDQPEEAVSLAQQGQTVLADMTVAPALTARLFAMEARGLAVQTESTA